MKSLQCPHKGCLSRELTPGSGRFIRSGFFRRKFSRRKIQRYRCKLCERTFSDQTFAPTYWQKRSELNPKVRELLCSQVSQRRTARLLRVSKTTVVEKFRFLAKEAMLSHERFLNDLSRTPLDFIQFDDLITSEHTKCKPVSVSLAVDAKTRMILGFQVSEIPARHPLVEISLKKYGPRKNERPEGLDRLFQGLKGVVSPQATFLSDSDYEYPEPVMKHFPEATHLQVKARKGAIAGFGELKKIGFDPLFSLNHTCAMLRANMNRLARRTWCTTKTRLGLIQHLALYVQYHNEHLGAGTPI